MTDSLKNQELGSNIGVGDILFTIFRHKWKIISCSAIGVVAAGIVWVTHKPLYESHAKVLVRYVADTKNPLEGQGEMIRSPDSRGNTVLNAEVEILRSSDSLLNAVQSITPKRILGATGGTNVGAAVGTIASNFKVEFSKNSSVIDLTLGNADPQVAHDTLDKLIRNYLRKHVEVHRAGNAYDDLQVETEALRTRLAQTEEELHTQKSKLGIVSLEETKKEIAVALVQLQKAIFDAEANIAERRAAIEAHYAAETNRHPVIVKKEGAAGAPTNTVATAPLSAEDLANYHTLVQKLVGLKARESDLLLTFTDEARPVRQEREQIRQAEHSLQALGIDPSSVLTKGPGGVAVQTLGNRNVFDGEAADAELKGQIAKWNTLTNQLGRTREGATRLESAENTIVQLERRKALEEARYTYYAKNLEQARLDQAIDSTKFNNISVIQEPTAGGLGSNKQKLQIAAAAIAGGVGLGLILAFLLDFVFNATVKRAKEVESSLKLPVLATVPDFGSNGHSRLKLSSSAVHHNGGAAGIERVAQDEWINGEVPPWEASDPMLPYYEALRDRIVMSYGEDLHKPKIVGLTSCTGGAGVTRLATGLAASLSRDVQRDVLLIALEKGKVSVSSFAKGRPAGEVDSSEANHEGQSLVRQDLQSLIATGRNRHGASVVQSFSDLMPMLRVSNYDYIIFDLPPVAQTSGSIRLASQMERTVLVVEAEKSSKEKIKKIKSDLSGSKTQLFTVVNKAKSYGPKSLHLES